MANKACIMEKTHTTFLAVLCGCLLSVTAIAEA